MSRVPAKLAVERDEYVYRSYLALGQYGIVLGEIKDTANTNVALRAVKLLATFISTPASRETAIFQMKEWLADAAVKNISSVRLIAATMYVIGDNVGEALKLLGVTNQEHLALRIQLFLRIDRVDLAQKELKAMKAIDEDSTLSMLATAWVNLALGGVKDKEAVYIYEELIDKHGGSSMLLCGLAVSKMHLGQFEEAEARLQEALIKVSFGLYPMYFCAQEAINPAQSPSDPDALANLIAVSQHLARAPEVINRLIRCVLNI